MRQCSPETLGQTGEPCAAGRGARTSSSRTPAPGAALVPQAQNRDRHSPGTRCRPQDTGLRPGVLLASKHQTCLATGAEPALPLPPTPWAKGSPLQPRDPSSVLPLPLIFLFQCRTPAPHPVLLRRKGCVLAQQKPQRGWSQTHTREHLLGTEPALRALSWIRERLGDSPAVSALFRAEFGSFSFQHGRLQLPERLPTSVERFANESRHLTGAREQVGPSPSTVGASPSSSLAPHVPPCPWAHEP